ncbi:MAG TPA: NADPH-dependent FMN reductase [Rhodothermales bacterium]|nr:NADPH-dependent FMN reductase [Rhodothermales bacterium]
MTVFPLHIIGMAGSLREGSYNRSLLSAAQRLTPEDLTIEVFPLDDIPLYNGDLENDADRPAEVKRLKRSLAQADGLLIATPEYNHGIPGVLKNAIDWASRPAFKSPLVGKPVGMMGAAPSIIGTARAQQHLKVVMLSMLAEVMPHRGVVVGNAKDKFDEEGHLIDEATQQFLWSYLQDWASWIRRISQKKALVTSAETS